MSGSKKRSPDERLSKRQRVREVVGKIFTPPTIGLMLGCIVAMIEPVQALFYHIEGVPLIFPTYPSISPPLGFISDAIESLASACTLFLVFPRIRGILTEGKSGSVYDFIIATRH